MDVEDEMTYEEALALAREYNENPEGKGLNPVAAKIVVDRLEEDKYAPLPFSTALFIAEQARLNPHISSKKVLEVIIKKLEATKASVKDTIEINADIFYQAEAAIQLIAEALKTEFTYEVALGLARAHNEIPEEIILSLEAAQLVAQRLEEDETAPLPFQTALYIAQQTKRNPNVVSAKALKGIKAQLEGTRAEAKETIELADSNRLYAQAANAIFLIEDAIKAQQEKDTKDQLMDVGDESEGDLKPTQDLTNGGIDFNSGGLGLDEKGGTIQFTMDNQMFSHIPVDHVQGVLPIIINITPIVNFVPLLGRALEERQEAQISYLKE